MFSWESPMTVGSCFHPFLGLTIYETTTMKLKRLDEKSNWGFSGRPHGRNIALLWIDGGVIYSFVLGFIWTFIQGFIYGFI